MVTTINTDEEIADIGFEGKQLRDLTTIIKTQSDLEELECFMIDNDDLSEISIVARFRKHMMGIHFVDKSTFMMEYEFSSNIQDKKEALEGLLKAHIDLKWVLELDSQLHKKCATLGAFYEAFILEPTLHIRRLILESIELS